MAYAARTNRLPRQRLKARRRPIRWRAVLTTGHQNTPDRYKVWTDHQGALIALAGAALSLCASGFIAGHNNNLFHLPILARLYDLPQFADDPFIQSLRYYSAGLWRLLAGSAPDDRAYTLLFALAGLSRLIFFGGALACAGLIGVADWRSRSIFAGLIAFSSLLRDYAYAGGGGLFITEFTHSEAASGTTLWVIFFAARGRYAESFAANGLTFFLNAFMAVWNAVPIALIAAAQLLRKDIAPLAMARRMAIGFALFLVIASPVIAAVLDNPEAGAQRLFDYRTYLFEYFPDHFFIAAIDRYEVKQLAIIVAIGLGALAYAGPDGRSLALALLGFTLVWAFGTIAPDLIGGNAVILLHLLRVSAEMQIVAAVGVAGLAARWITQGASWRSRLWGPALAFVTTFAPHAVMWALPILAAGKIRHRLLPPRLIGLALFACLAFYAWPGRVLTKARNARHETAAIARWRDIGAWARAQTPAGSVFLIPVTPIRDGPGSLARYDPVRQQLGDGSEVFEFAAHRRVWVDYKRGGVIMWQPGYYPRWKRDAIAVMALASLAERRAYAHSHGIGFVVDACAPTAGTTPLHRAGDLCVYPS